MVIRLTWNEEYQQFDSAHPDLTIKAHRVICESEQLAVWDTGWVSRLNEYSGTLPPI